MNERRAGIWFVTACGPQNIGGGETAVRQWTEEFQKNGEGVVWYCPGKSRNRNDQQGNLPDGVSLRFLEGPDRLRGRCYSLNEVKKFFRDFSSEEPEGVIFSGLSPTANFPIMFGLARRGFEGMVQVHHGDPIPQRGDCLKMRLKSLLVPLLTRIPGTMVPVKHIAVSRWVKKRVEDKGLARKVDVCYPPIASDNCSPRLRSEVNSGRKLRAVVVTRISPEKGMDYLVELGRHIQGNLPVSLELAGVAADKRYLEEVLSKLSGRVRYLGLKLGSDLCQVYRDTDVVVLISPNEGFGLVTVEGLWHGAPVVGRDIPATREIFKNTEGMPGVLVSDPSEMANVLSELAEDDQRLFAMSQSAIDVRSWYNPDNLRRRFVDLVSGGL